ncbi:MAG: cell division ATP-binding protein FtsE [Pacificimonas sp.]|jgi:cell division transport system ATP-binding protein|nr:cell division ATP-binding protein FtsE [Pacificimonas sp.]
MGPLARFETVGLRYGTDAEVLRDISFRLDRGAFMFLVGPSGAGKTSLLKLLYLDEKPTRGRLTLFGKDIGAASRGELTALRRRVGVVFQDFRLLDHLSAFENVALPLRIAGVAESEVTAHVEELLGWVGLSAKANVRPQTLSGGEQQRLAIARAVIARPDLLLCDEPTGNVDPEMAARLLHLFQELNRLGTTVVVATHALQLLPRVPSATIMRLERGRIEDPTGTVRYAPDSTRAVGTR